MVAIVGTGWRLAPSLVALIDEADSKWPTRSIASDGSIGDAAHAKRISDHNPDASGDVLAVDLTDDKWAGCDADAFAEHLLARRDPRIKYVICNGRIFRSYGSTAWQWTPYTGINGHFAHTHVSILDTEAAKFDTSPWFPPSPEDDVLTPTEAQQLKDTRAEVADIKKTVTDALGPGGWVVTNFLLVRSGLDEIDDTGPVDAAALATAVAQQLGPHLARELGEALIAGSEG
jgi:hypothetical protein